MVRFYKSVALTLTLLALFLLIGSETSSTEPGTRPSKETTASNEPTASTEPSIEPSTRQSSEPTAQSDNGDESDNGDDESDAPTNAPTNAVTSAPSVIVISQTITYAEALTAIEQETVRSTYEAQLYETFGDTASGWIVTIAEARRVGYVLSSTATTSDPEAFDEVQESSSESFITALSSSLASAGVEAASISAASVTITAPEPDASNESSDGGGALVIVIVIVILVVIGGAVAACFFCKSCPGYKMCNKDENDEPPESEFVGIQMCAATENSKENLKQDDMPKEEEPTCYINGQPVYKNSSDEDVRKLRG